MEPIVLFGIQFSLSLAAYGLIAWWYVLPRLARMPREAALVPLLWIHAFRVIGGAILAPGAVDAAVPMDFRLAVGVGDMTTALLAILALVALRMRLRGAISAVWLFIVVATLDTLNAIVQSIRYDAFTHALGVNWLIVACYVPALVVSSVVILGVLLRRGAHPARDDAG
jgi:hypothetical protein